MDRGAWGVEVLALLMAYKWLLPHNVYLVRGNHESNIITQVYGFAAELKAKYGKAAKVNTAAAYCIKYHEQTWPWQVLCFVDCKQLGWM